MKNSLEDIRKACDFRDLTHENIQFSMRRGADLSDEFARLEVQIATILFAFSGLFIRFFTDDVLGAPNGPFSEFGILSMKWMFALSLGFLVASLILGLFHIKVTERFWSKFLDIRSKRFKEWWKVIDDDCLYAEAYAFYKGTISEESVVYSPRWPWILQTIFLAIAIFFILTLATLFIFAT